LRESEGRGMEKGRKKQGKVASWFGSGSGNIASGGRKYNEWGREKTDSWFGSGSGNITSGVGKRQIVGSGVVRGKAQEQ